MAKKLAKIAEIYGFCSMKPRFLNQITFDMRKALKVGRERINVILEKFDNFWPLMVAKKLAKIAEI